jgi:hypothetical protein
MDTMQRKHFGEPLRDLLTQIHIRIQLVMKPTVALTIKCDTMSNNDSNYYYYESAYDIEV